MCDDKNVMKKKIWNKISGSNEQLNGVDMTG